MELYEQYLGKTLDGKYVIKELLGIGGMSYVFKAHVLGTNDVVSIKIMNEEFIHDEKAVKRFINESKAISMLSHKNIVGVYDVSFKSDINYIAMEFVDGITLKEYIDYKKKLAWGEAAYYVSQVLKALSHAHDNGIIHRDIKPQNIMITRDGVIKVMDFGIAKMTNSKSITMTDKAIGTVDYISPEQASAKPVGFYSDIYSLGVMLYEMTTGKLPFVADSPMAVAMMQIQNEPTPPSEINADLPQGLEQIILKAMNKEPDDRFSSCAAMDKAISLVIKDPSIIFTQQKTTNKKKKTPSRKKKSTFLPVVAGVTLSFFIVAIICAVSIGIKFYNSQFSNMGEDIRIPNLVGTIYSENLREQLYSDNFEITVENSEYDKTKQIGEIVEQIPEGGTTRKLSNPNSSCAITIKINAEPGKIVLEDYTNTEARIARMQLTKLGLVPETVTEKHKTVIEGYIISTDPAPGTTLEAGATVTLKISSGAPIEVTRMPEIVGLNIEDAKKALQAKEISIGDIIYRDSDKPANTVLSASYPDGELVPQKIAKVSITVSLGNLVSDYSDNSEKPEDEKTETDKDNSDESAKKDDQADKNETEPQDEPSEL